MQKNKSFSKASKVSKQISSCSSRALLQLSQITANSKDKSGLMQNFSQRSGYPSTFDLEGSQNDVKYSSKTKEKAKSNSKKQTYLRQKAPLSNSALNQIIQISNSLPIRNINAESSKLMQKDSDLIIFSKSDLQKNKNFSQTKKNKKLLLYENKQNHEKTMSKSKSSYSQIIKAEPILCSIKINPLDEQRSNYNVSCSQNRQSIEGRRSSFSSRRSSIHLFPQDDIHSQIKMNEIKNSFLAKISLADQGFEKKNQGHGRVDNFLKNSNSNFYEQNSYSEEIKPNEMKQTRENETQITPREKKQVRQKYLLKLDELNVIEEDIRKDALKFIQVWDQKMESEKNLKKYRKNFEQVKKNYEKVLNESTMLKNLLFEENKRHVMSKRMSTNNFNSQKQSILLQVEKIHTDVKKKVFKKDLEETMIFDMKVVLPSSQLMESSMSCFDNHINASLNYSNITILQLYQEMMNQKACKKYGMILKKQINNMNIYDNRTMNEYLKKLYELETIFNKVQGQDPQNDTQYLERIEDIVEKIEEIGQEFSRVQKNYLQLDQRIQFNERAKKQSDLEFQNLLNFISESIYFEYKIFQTGGKAQSADSKLSSDSAINESFTETDKPISEFRQLVAKKYEGLFNRYKQVREQKKMIIDSLKSYQ